MLLHLIFKMICYPKRKILKHPQVFRKQKELLQLYSMEVFSHIISKPTCYLQTGTAAPMCAEQEKLTQLFLTAETELLKTTGTLSVETLPK